MKLYNTRTRKVEEFVSIEPGVVRMYSCGPTVYDSVHIGNLRAFTFADLLKRALTFAGYRVDHIMNITDFGHLVGDGDDGEDKMSVGLKREGFERSLEGMKMLADKYSEVFFEDLKKLNILPARAYPRAIEHIDKYIELIKKLEDKGFIYTTSDGIYFDTDKDAHYGELALLDRSKEKDAESRLAKNTEKKNERDFALWKFADVDGIKNKIGFDSPWGFGFPGWHIECSGMSWQYLGEHFDVHTGGVDHISVHHTNEIAQSENAHGVTYANFFCHNEFLNMGEEKMSKSKGNVYTLRDIEDRDITPLSFRYFLLQSHYRQNANFTWEALEASQTAHARLLKQIEKFENVESSEADKNYLDKFKHALFEDLNTAKALALVWTLLKDKEVSEGSKKATLQIFDEVLALSLFA
jgi:cysteinyl-tRNA synthetase